MYCNIKTNKYKGNLRKACWLICIGATAEYIRQFRKSLKRDHLASFMSPRNVALWNAQRFILKVLTGSDTCALRVTFRKSESLCGLWHPRERSAGFKCYFAPTRLSDTELLRVRINAEIRLAKGKMRRQHICTLLLFGGLLLRIRLCGV